MGWKGGGGAVPLVLALATTPALADADDALADADEHNCLLWCNAWTCDDAPNCGACPACMPPGPPSSPPSLPGACAPRFQPCSAESTPAYCCALPSDGCFRHAISHGIAMCRPLETPCEQRPLDLPSRMALAAATAAVALYSAVSTSSAAKALAAAASFAAKAAAAATVLRPRPRLL